MPNLDRFHGAEPPDDPEAPLYHGFISGMPCHEAQEDVLWLSLERHPQCCNDEDNGGPFVVLHEDCIDELVRMRDERRARREAKRNAA